MWNRDQIAEGISLTESALRSRRFGAYTLQADIAAVHAESSSTASTDWRQITLLEQNQVSVARGSGGAARLLQQHRANEVTFFWSSV